MAGNKNIQVLSGLMKAISSLTQRTEQNQETQNSSGTNEDVETTIKKLFPSTNGGNGESQNLQTAGRNDTGDDGTADRSFVEDRGRFQPKRNYVPKGKKRSKPTGKSEAKKVKSNVKHTEQRSTIKDVVLLPGPKFNKVPRGITREALFAHGFVTTIELKPTASEESIREDLEEKFRRKLLGCVKSPKFEFVRAINSKIILQKNQDCPTFDGRMLKHLSGQGPLYIRATTDVSASLNLYLNLKDDAQISDESESDEDGQNIVETTMLNLPKVKHPEVIDVEDGPSNLSNRIDVYLEAGRNSASVLESDSVPHSKKIEPVPECTQELSEVPIDEKSSWVSCPTCFGQFKSDEIESHADSCAESHWFGSGQLIYANLMSNLDDEEYPDPIIPNETLTILEEDGTKHAGEVTNKEFKDRLSGLVKDLQKKMGLKTNRINVQPKSVLADYIETRKRCPWFLPENNLKVIFIGEPAIDDGGPKREFFTDIIEQLKMRLFDRNGIPIESTLALADGNFKYCGELMAMSVVQGGPAPNFLSPLFYDVIAKGLHGTYLSLDMIDNAKLKAVAMKIDNAVTDEQLRSILMEDDVLDVLSSVGYRGIPSRESLACKDNLIRSIIIKSQIEPKLGMLNQLKEGLAVYGLLDMVQGEPDFFKPVFVPGEMFTVTSDEFLDELVVTYSEKQLEKHAEETTFKHFCGFVELLHHVGIKEHNLTLRDLLRFTTGSYELPPLGLPGSISVKFVHGCVDGCKCRPTVSTCQLVLYIPVHASTFDEVQELMVSAMLEGFGFGNI